MAATFGKPAKWLCEADQCIEPQRQILREADHWQPTTPCNGVPWLCTTHPEHHMHTACMRRVVAKAAEAYIEQEGGTEAIARRISAFEMDRAIELDRDRCAR